MIYLDNAATSFPKPRTVVREVIKCLTQYCGNPGRSSHGLALAAADKIFETRVEIADFLGAEKCENVIFTPNATYALNLVIKGLVNEKCHCIISDIEHNSVLRPLYKMVGKYGGSISVFDSDNALDEAIIPLIREDTKIIISTLCSNVTGKVLDFHKLSEIANRYGLHLVIDASQYLGHCPISLNDAYYTALCSAGHKALFGIQGSAFALIKNTEVFDTLTEGGSGVDSFSSTMPILLPERYEAGTVSTPAIASLGAGIDFIRYVGIDKIEERLKGLTDMIKSELSAIREVKLYGADNGIAAFNVRDYPSSYVSEYLNSFGIATRSGFHCAPLIHKKLGTEKSGAVRVSLSYFNSENDIHNLVKALKKI